MEIHSTGTGLGDLIVYALVTFNAVLAFLNRRAVKPSNGHGPRHKFTRRRRDKTVRLADLVLLMGDELGDLATNVHEISDKQDATNKRLDALEKRQRA